jgi:3-deoxy-D-manno-octulosonic-acid transferase
MQMVIFFILYNFVFFPIFFIIAHLAIPFHDKVRMGLLGRYRTNWIKKDFSRKKSASKPLILIHCASMGEFEHIKPFIRSFKQHEQQSLIVVMFFSPSGYENVKQFPGVDLFIYSPIDWWLPVLRTFRILKPAAVIIAKHDVWPNQVWIANFLQIPCVLINASLHSKSRRLRPLVRNFHKSIYNNLSRIITISKPDAENYKKVAPEADIIIAGDTKFEQVILRMEESQRKMVITEAVWQNKKVLVAGSVWPEDEDHLTPAIKNVAAQFPDLLVIACPHEPTDTHIDELQQKLLPISVCLFSQLNNYDSETVVIVDKIGLLANLYSIAQMAYVGGSFKQNIHNVLEPAVYGIPVIFGPVNQNSREAQLLKKSGGGFEVHNSAEIEDAVIKFFKDDFYRRKIGTFASNVVMENTGATQRTIEAILPFLEAS